MKLECSKNKLLEALRRVEKIATKHATLPVLSCVLCSTENNVLTLRTTNLDVGIEIKIPVKTEQVGTVALPAQVFSACIAGIHDEKLILEVVDGNVAISSPQGNFKLKAYPHEDFPTIPLVSEEVSVVINSKDLVKGIKSVVYASAISSMKPELSSVYIYSDDNFIFFVATDSFRLAEKKIPLKKKIPIPPILIPFRNANEITRVFDGLDEEIECHISKNQISLISQDIHVTSRVIDGVFPDYKQIIPKEFTTEVTFLKDDIVNALRLATIFSDKFNQVKLNVLKNKKTLEIDSKNNDTGESKHKIPASIEGGDIEATFNHRYINDSFQSIEGESITISLVGPQRPAIIKSASDSSFTYVAMPMNR